MTLSVKSPARWNTIALWLDTVLVNLLAAEMMDEWSSLCTPTKQHLILKKLNSRLLFGMIMINHVLVSKLSLFLRTLQGIIIVSEAGCLQVDFFKPQVLTHLIYHMLPVHLQLGHKMDHQQSTLHIETAHWITVVVFIIRLFS